MDLDNQKKLENLVLASMAGDEAAFHQLYDSLADRLFKFIFSRCNSREDSLDLLQDIFVDIWKALPKFKYSTDAEFYGFVFKICRRKLSKYYRFGRHKNVEFDEKYIVDNYEINTEDYWLLEKVLPQLKIKYREVLQLRYWADFSYAQIAAWLNSKESTVKVRHHRAIKEISKIMAQYQNDYK